MKITNNQRTLNILNKAIEIGFELDESLRLEDVKNEAINYLIKNNEGIEEECDVLTMGSHGQRVDWSDGKGFDFWSQGEIVDFKKHWFDLPKTKVFFETLVDSFGNVIRLYYVVGETEYNAPEGFFYDKKTKCHKKIK